MEKNTSKTPTANSSLHPSHKDLLLGPLFPPLLSPFKRLNLKDSSNPSSTAILKLLTISKLKFN